VGGRNSVYEYTKTCFDNNNNIIIAGNADSNNGIADLNSYQPNIINGTTGFTGTNFYLIKFRETTVTGIPQPESNSPICIGNTLELKVSGGTSYSWTGPNGFTSTNQNPTINNASALNTGKYSCNITGIGGCDGIVDVDVLVGDNQAPVPNLTTLQTITGDCKTTITIIPTATDACAGIITATTANPLSYSLAGTYTIVWNYDDGNGNSVTQSQWVIISPKPLPTTTSQQIFCIQNNPTLSSVTITGQNIKWYDALTNGNLLVNTTLLQNGITYCASQTINGCESERSPVLINIQNTVTPTAISPQTFCTSQNPTLANLVIVGTSIKWYDNTTSGSLLPSSTPLQDGTTYYAIQTLNNCESTTRLAVTVGLISTLPASNYEELFCDDLNDGTETVDLRSYNSKIISNTNNYNFSYYDSSLGAQNETQDSKINNLPSYKLVVGENKIYVRINSNTPCYAVAELKLTLFSKPVINIQDIVPICDNNSITIDGGTGFDSYLWSNGETTPKITVSTPGLYSVTLTENHNTLSCSSTKSFRVKQSSIAKISSIETKDWTDKDNMITIIATGDYEYSIDGETYQDDKVFSGLSSGVYTVYVRDKNNCGLTTQDVYLLIYAKFFTPNGDGYNDTWKIKFSDTEVGLIIKIFDRYGKLIKNLVSNSDSWDGTFNGSNLPADDYWFIATRANGQEHKGHFSLKR
jgi:gliding motility-associated-like protein